MHWHSLAAFLRQEYEGQTEAWTFEGSWQESYLAAGVPGYRRGSKRPRRVEGLYSDLLYQPWFCTSVAIDPAWLEVGGVRRMGQWLGGCAFGSAFSGRFATVP